MAEMNSRGLARVRLIIWGLVILVAMAASALYFIRPPERPVGLFGGKFTLESTAGGEFTEQDLKGTPSMVFFGYTYCPDVCPTTLADTTRWRQQLGLTADQLRLIFVSVDPERDTIETMKDYLSAFGAPIIGLTGAPENVEDAKRAFGVYSQKVDDTSSTEYLVDHTANVFLLDAQGRYQSTISWGEPSDTAIGKIKKLAGI